MKFAAAATLLTASAADAAPVKRAISDTYVPPLVIYTLPPPA
jgi:hypothetical protein